MKSGDSKYLSEIEELIRAGLHRQAQKSLSRVSTAKVERRDYARLANLLRRTSLVHRGLRLLNPLIRDPKVMASATPQEKMEYANLLVKVGALEEARKILMAMDRRLWPDSLLYLTFTLTPEWRYQETIPLLEQYIEQIDGHSYPGLVAKVNLIAALLFVGDRDAARSLIAEARELAQKHNARFLLGSIFELEAQNAISEGDFVLAARALTDAAELFRSSNTVESLYAKKWRSVLDFLRAKDSVAEYPSILSMRQRAMAANEWEIVRDLDFQILKRLPNSETFSHLFCGSPSALYRERLQTTFPGLRVPPEDYVWTKGALKARTRLRVLDVHAGINHTGSPFLDRGQAPHRLLVILCRDFYRPIEIAKISADLYPDEFYHPVHTPIKVHQVASRLRHLLQEARLPLQILGESGALKIEVPRGYGLKKNWKLDRVVPVKTQMELDPLFSQLGKSFTAREVARALDVSLSSATRRLNKMVATGVLSRSGHGRTTRFELSQSEPNEKLAG